MGIETTDNPLRTITSTCFHAIEFLFYLLLCNCLYVLKMLFVSLNKKRNTDTQNPYAHFPSKRPFFSAFEKRLDIVLQFSRFRKGLEDNDCGPRCPNTKTFLRYSENFVVT